MVQWNINALSYEMMVMAGGLVEGGLEFSKLQMSGSQGMRAGAAADSQTAMYCTALLFERRHHAG